MPSLVPILQLQNLSRVFAHGAIRAVDGLCLDVLPGEIMSILGPSGCGKTTTMRMIAGLDHPSSGDIRIFGESVLGKPPHRRNVGLVFQSLAVFPHMTVQQNVAFGLRMQRMGRQQIAEKVDRILQLVQLPQEQFADRYPAQLSGGQLQRVALARTLVTEPALVLFDEPMAALDRRLRDYMAGELRAIQKKLGIAAVYVTHDQETASAMSDRIAIMEAGTLVQVDTPEAIYERPASRFVAAFLGDANFLKPDAIGARRDECRTIQICGVPIEVIDPGTEDGGDAVAMVRPEHVEIHLQPTDHPSLKGTIVGSQFAGGVYRWQIELADRRRIAVRSTIDTVGKDHRGGESWLSIKSRSAMLLRQ